MPKTINSVFFKFKRSLNKDLVIIPIPGQKIVPKYRLQSAYFSIPVTNKIIIIEIGQG